MRLLSCFSRSWGWRPVIVGRTKVPISEALRSWGSFMPEARREIIDWWRNRLADDKQLLADIEAGRIPADEIHAAYLRWMIPQMEAIVQSVERHGHLIKPDGPG